MFHTECVDQPEEHRGIFRTESSHDNDPDFMCLPVHMVLESRYGQLRSDRGNAGM